MYRIRVFVGLAPRVLAEFLVASIERQPDMAVVGGSSDPVEILAAARSASADVVLLGTPERAGHMDLCSQLLSEDPSLVVIALSVAEDHAVVYRREIVSHEISASEQAVLSAIRSAAREAIH